MMRKTRTWLALAGLSLSMLLASLGTSIANVWLPALAKAFAVSFQEVQWVVLAYLLAITTLIVSVGRLGDILGRRRLLLAGISLFTVASILCGVSETFWLLIAARVLQWLGAAIMMALSMALVGEIVPKERTGSAMGLLGTMSAIGTASGPVLGGMLISVFGWQAIFFVGVPLGVLAFLSIDRYLPVDGHRSLQANSSKFDIAGTVLLVLALSAYSFAMSPGHGGFGILTAILLAFAVLGAALFVFAESKVTSPLIRLEMFHNPTLSRGFIMMALATVIVMATLVIGPFYLSGGLGLGMVHVWLVMSAGPITAALIGMPAGRMVDRFGTKRIIVTGLVAMAIGSFALSVMPMRIGIFGYVAPLMTITAGYALFQAANNTAVMTDVEANHKGAMSGLLNLSRNLGLITGTSAMSALFSFGVKAADIAAASPEAIWMGMGFAFAVATILVFVAIIIASMDRAPLKCSERLNGIGYGR